MVAKRIDTYASPCPASEIIVLIAHWLDWMSKYISGLILGLRPADERRRYKVTPSLIGWAQT